MLIRPEKDLGQVLRRVENPARYVGGEFGSLCCGGGMRCAVCFPDLYEIGMSNQAVAVLYGMLNSLEGVSCDRVFCPAEDFEKELEAANVPLYGLESGLALCEFDIVAFTLGYELCASNVLTMLRSGGIPLAAGERTSGPIVIAGGPALGNPVPFGLFFDAVYIGEAEAEFRSLVPELALLKKRGADRAQMLTRLRESPAFWYRGKTDAAKRSVWMDFPSSLSWAQSSPVPSLRTVQDHGVVEIMRGCANGCRFCQAGVYYRPYRMKKPEKIYQEVCNLIHKCGYREITLSSLSSGDYTDIASLIRTLNAEHGKKRVSFSLPSLHLESFGIQILSEISRVRKSGLTFAVETPLPEFQVNLNKPASREKIISILKEAKAQGWKLAKFYFMVGLPFYTDRQREADDISGFLRSVYQETRISLNLTLGAFVPKPHTPYERAAQLTEEEAAKSIRQVKRGIAPFSIKVGYHAPFQSYLEGLFSRGDERAGDLLLEAWKEGARFDAWEDRSHPEAWRRVFAAAPWDVEAFVSTPRPEDAVLPWRGAVSLGVKASVFAEECRRGEEAQLTDACGVPCTHPCGVCGGKVFPVNLAPLSQDSDLPQGGGGEDAGGGSNDTLQEAPASGAFCIRRHIVVYERTGKAAFLPHLSLMQVMERSLLRAGIPLRFTGGFNPKPVLEFAQAAPVGVESLEEVFSFETFEEPFKTPEADSEEAFVRRLNACLPESLRVVSVSSIIYREKEKKPPSLMSLYAGGRYELEFPPDSPELEKTVLGVFEGKSGFREVSRNENLLVFDYTEEQGSRGFRSLLKETLGERLPEIKVRKLLTSCRLGGKIGSYREIAEIGKNEG